MDINYLIEKSIKVRVMYLDDSWNTGFIRGLDTLNKIIAFESDNNKILIPLSSVKFITFNL